MQAIFSMLCLKNINLHMGVDKLFYKMPQLDDIIVVHLQLKIVVISTTNNNL